MFVCVYSSVSLFAQAVSLDIWGPHASAPDPPPTPPQLPEGWRRMCLSWQENLLVSNLELE